MLNLIRTIFIGTVFIGVFCLAVSLSEASAAEGITAKFLNVSSESHDHRTRVTIDLTSPVDFQVFRYDQKNYLIIDIESSGMDTPRRVVEIDDGLIRRVRLAQNTPGSIRTVIELLPAEYRYRYFSLTDPFQIVMDVYSTEELTLTPAPPAEEKLGLADYLKQGEDHLAASKYLQAADAFSRAVSLAPNSTEAHFGLGRAYYNLGKNSDAIRELRRTISLRSGHPGAYYFAGLIRERQRQYDMARINFGYALKGTAYERSAREHLNRLPRPATRTESPAEAEVSTSAPVPMPVVLIDPTAESDSLTQSSLKLYSVANEALTTGKFQEAVDAYRAFLETNPDHAQAHFRLGVTHFMNSEDSEAVPQFNTALAQNQEPGFRAVVNSYLALIEIGAGNTGDAEFRLQQAKTDSSVAPYARYSLSRLYRDQGNVEQADFELSQIDTLTTPLAALADLRGSFPAYVLAMIAADSGVAEPVDTGPAGLDLTVITPDENSLYSLALDHLNQGNYDRASDAFREFITMFPRSPLVKEAFIKMANMYSSLHLYNESNAILERMLANYPPNDDLEIEATIHMAYNFFQSRDYRRAAEKLNKLMTEFPAKTMPDDVHLLMGDVLMERGQYAQAARSYDKILWKSDQTDFYILAKFKQGKAYKQAGQLPDALGAFREVINSFGTLPESIKIIEALDDLEIDPDLVKKLRRPIEETYFSVGEVQYLMGNFAEAIDAYNHAITRFPQSVTIPYARYQIASAYARIGDYQGARDHFNDLAGMTGLYPNSFWVQEAGQRKDQMEAILLTQTGQ
jgi:tetratricopeptide (TPR) repeat protein